MISKKVWLKVTYTIIILLAIALMPFMGVTAPSTQAAEPPQAQEAPMLPPREEPLPPGTGFRAPEMDLSHLTGQRMPEESLVQLPGRDGEEPKAQVPPVTWDWRTTGKVTSVKNQNPCGSCYAFASIGNIESKMLIDGAATLPQPDYSENNAKECNWRELHGYESPPGTHWGSCDGGNYWMLASLFSQKGLVLESCDPYVPADVACNDTCPYQKTLLDWRIISTNAVPNTDVLKSYIQTYGPVYVSMYADSSEGFNSSYNGLYTFDYSATGTNHAVLIIGWSNNLPPVPGGTTPADGWIVKNSWGAGWGDSGYFYITYGSANIGMYSSFMYDWQDYDNNGGIMFYDDDGWSNDWGYGDTTAWGLAKFSPSSNTSVTRVEFWTTDETTDVDVYLYDNFDAGALSDLLWSSPNHSFAEAGYHGVAVDPPLAVTGGHDVVAVVKFTNDSDNYPIPADKNGPHETGCTYISYTGANGSWSDLGVAEQNDVAIRLRTSQDGAPDITVTPPFYPDPFEVTRPPDTIWTKTLTIGNVGGASLSYNISDEDCPWLDESPKSGSVEPGGSHNVTVTINTTGLAVSDYGAEIIVSSNDPDEPEVTVPVTLHVSGGTLELVEGVNIICYPGATGTLGEALTNIGPGGLDVAEIIWARAAWTDGQWWFYNVAQDFAYPPGEFTHLENGRAYLIVVSENCSWELL